MFLPLFYLTLAHPSIVSASPVPNAAAPSPACDSGTLSAGNTIHRSTLQLVWSCLAVIFASTWVCVHPNVPGYKSTWEQRLKARIKLSAVAIFAPEFIALYAFFQWRGCRQLHREIEGKAMELDIPLKLPSGESAWTHVHAHFIQMGGIVFKHEEAVYFSNPAKWNEEQIAQFFKLELTEDAILDKSKGDALAKGLALVQVVWFIVQSIARAAQGLPLALLEAACLAFTAFNFGVYFFWWLKPLNVAQPFELVCPSLNRDDGRNGERDPRELRSSLAQLFSAYEMLNGLATGLASLGGWQTTGAPTAYRSIYWHDKEEGYRRTLDTLVFAVMSSCFGALHTIAWRSQFPTFAEEQLWRYSCIVLTVYPLAHLLVVGGGVMICCCGSMFIGGALLPFFMGVAACGYAAARVILFHLPFLQLRSLPEAVHQTVAWADFLPHI